MLTYTGTTTTFQPIANGSVNVTGYVYRVVPHYAVDVTDTSFSFSGGGRWNAPMSHHVLYTSASVQLAWNFANWHADHYFGVTPEELPAERQPDLAVFTYTAQMADLVTDPGLTFWGLPTNYPAGYETSAAYVQTWPIGQKVFDSGFAGIACRSALVANFIGPIASWADLAVFTQQSPAVTLTDRLAFEDWYRYV